MITRIVRMTFHPEFIEAFIEQFSTVQPKILQMKGCQGVELFHDSKYDNIMTTISHWNSEDDLNSYRSSTLFQDTWHTTKKMFCAKPVAETYYKIKSH